MTQEVTPGETGSILCPHCSGSIFFAFKGGPHQLQCPNCKREVSVEVVHDGTKWRAKVPGGSRP